MVLKLPSDLDLIPATLPRFACGMTQPRSNAGSSTAKKGRRASGASKEESGKKRKSKGKVDLGEQVRSMGGDEADVKMLSGVRDEQLVQGSQEADVRVRMLYVILHRLT